MTHAQLIELVEVELSDDEEMVELFKQWKAEEVEDLKADLIRYAAKRIRRIENQKRLIERWTGIKVGVRLPRRIVKAPERLYEAALES